MGDWICWIGWNILCQKSEPHLCSRGKPVNDFVSAFRRNTTLNNPLSFGWSAEVADGWDRKSCRKHWNSFFVCDLVTWNFWHCSDSAGLGGKIFCEMTHEPSQLICPVFPKDRITTGVVDTAWHSESYGLSKASAVGPLRVGSPFVSVGHLKSPFYILAQYLKISNYRSITKPYKLFRSITNNGNLEHYIIMNNHSVRDMYFVDTFVVYLMNCMWFQ